MSGAKVVWESTSVPPKLQQISLKSTPNMYLYKESTGGLSAKYHAQLIIPSSVGADGKRTREKRFYVGKFDTEDEATRVTNKVNYINELL